MIPGADWESEEARVTKDHRVKLGMTDCKKKKRKKKNVIH